MKLLLLVVTLHKTGTLTPPKMFQLCQDAEGAALTLYTQEKTAPPNCSVTGELFEIDLMDKTIKSVSMPIIQFVRG